MKYVLSLLVALACLGGMAWAVHSRGYDEGVAATKASADKQVKAAKADAQAANDERDAKAQTLDNVMRTMAEQRAELDRLKEYAIAAMARNVAERPKLAAATVSRTNKTRSVAHESPACTDLARLPVCPALSDRLWPQAAGSAPGPSH
jgi:hypothetical protein